MVTVDTSYVPSYTRVLEFVVRTLRVLGSYCTLVTRLEHTQGPFLTESFWVLPDSGSTSGKFLSYPVPLFHEMFDTKLF